MQGGECGDEELESRFQGGLGWCGKAGRPSGQSREEKKKKKQNTKKEKMGCFGEVCKVVVEGGATASGEGRERERCWDGGCCI